MSTDSVTPNRTTTASSHEAAQASSPTPEAIVCALVGALTGPTQADAPEERNS